MRYRAYGNTGIKVSALGFGAMHLPMIGQGKDARVNDELAIPLLREAYDAGINYFDTAWFYCNDDSQRAVGKALKDVRDKVYIATKLPVHLVKERDDFWKFLFGAMEQMDTEYVDFYHFHGIGAEGFAKLKELKIVESAERALAKGYIKHLSFSFHDNPDALRELVDTGLFSSLLCQYNLIFRDLEENIAYAASKGVGVAVMGPVAGGMLAKGGKDFLDRIHSDAENAAEMAFRFVWGNPGVSTALSGMRNVEQLRENLKYAQGSDSVPPGEVDALCHGAEELKKRNDVYCTGCDYCKVCPKDINPSFTFKQYINHKVWGFSEEAKSSFKWLGTGGLWNTTHPDECDGCGACSERCPQKLDIPAELKRISGILKAL